MNTTIVQSRKLETVPPAAKPEAPKDATGKPVSPKLLRAAKLVKNTKAVTTPKVTDKMRRDRILGVIGKEAPATEEAAMAALHAAVPLVARDVVRLDAVGVTRLAMAMRPTVAFFCSTRAGKEQMTVNARAADTIVRYVKRDLGKTAHMSVNRAGTNTSKNLPVILKRVSAWETLGRNKAEASRLLQTAAKAAILWVYPDAPVTLGWLPNEPKKVRSVYGTKPLTKGCPGICAPANVLQPVLYNWLSSERDGAKGFPGEQPENNPDKRLIGLDSTLIDALYSVWIGGVDATYETHVSNRDMGMPTGMLTIPRAARKANAGTGATTTDAAKATEGGQLPDPRRIFEVARVYRDVPPAQWPTDAKDIREHIAAYAYATACLLNRACLSGVVPTKSFADSQAAAILVDVKRCLDPAIRIDDSGKASDSGNAYILRDGDGTRFKISEDKAPRSVYKAPDKAKVAKAKASA